MELRKQFNRKYGTYKALVTRYKNRGYDIKDEYQPPKKITEASFRRLEKARAEIQRQKDVQDAKAFIRAKEAFDDVMKLIREYMNGSILGRVGKDDEIGFAIKGDAYLLKQGSANDLELALRDAYDEMTKTPEKSNKFADNVKNNMDFIDDLVEKYVLAAYRKKTAQWSGTAGERYSEYMRTLSAFNGLLKRSY